MSWLSDLVARAVNVVLRWRKGTPATVSTAVGRARGAGRALTITGGGGGVPANSAVPTISGTAQAGSLLSSTTGSWTNPPITTYAYQWQRSANGTSGWSDISGATGATYLLAVADVNAYVRSGARASNATGPAAAFAYSAASAQIAAAPVVTTTGTRWPLFDATYGGGPSYTYQHRLAQVPWDNAGGDWFGAGETAQGATPYASVTDTSSAANHAVSVNVTTLLQFCQVNGKSPELFFRSSGTRYFASIQHPTSGFWPTISVTYTDATTATLACRGDGFLDSSTSYSSSKQTEFQVTTGRNAWARFDPPTKPVSAATLNLTATQSFGGNATINVFRVRNQADKALTVQQGIAAAYPLDAGIEANPAVVRRFNFQGTQSTWKADPVGDINSPNWWDPNSPPTDTTKLPLLQYGKWIGPQTADYSNYEVVSDTYTQFGFAPLYAGQRAIHNWFSTDKNVAMAWETFIWPAEPELYLRYYLFLGDNFFDNVDRGDVEYIDLQMNGKFGLGFAHRSVAGNGGSQPDGTDGWTMRANFTPIANSADPKWKAMMLGDYPYSMDFYYYNENWGQGAGGLIERGRWYCIERYIKVNTPNVRDGISRAWVDGKLVYEKTNHIWRGNPPYYSSGGPIAARRVYGDMSIIGVWWDTWNGGLQNPPNRADCFISDVVISRNYIGPMAQPAPAVPVPSWAPAAGDTATYSTGGGVLTNTWRAISDPTGIGFDPFYSANCTDYSATFLHKDWRTHGANVIWGGGHSGTNYNAITALTFTATQMYFECLQTGTPWTAGVNPPNKGDTTSQYNNFGEATVGPAGRLASPHSYGNAEVIDGKLTQTQGVAAGDLGLKDGNACHEIDLTNPATSSAARQWVRRAGGSFPSATGSSAPWISRYVAAQNRIYVCHRAGGVPANFHWFDRASNAYVEGSGTGFAFPGSTLESGGMVYAAVRDLLICCYRSSGGQLVVQYANVAAGVTQPVAATASLSEAITVPDEWQAVSWCPDSQRLLLFNVNGQPGRVYEVTIPGTVTSTWSITFHTLPGGKTIVPPSLSVYAHAFDYNPKTKCIAFMPNHIAKSGNDSVQVYRPRNT